MLPNCLTSGWGYSSGIECLPCILHLEAWVPSPAHTHTKRAGAMAQVGKHLPSKGPEFKLQDCKKTKQNKTKKTMFNFSFFFVYLQ
jgi:hypothetical protein